MLNKNNMFLLSVPYGSKFKVKSGNIYEKNKLLINVYKGEYFLVTFIDGPHPEMQVKAMYCYTKVANLSPKEQIIQKQEDE